MENPQTWPATRSAPNVGVTLRGLSWSGWRQQRGMALPARLQGSGAQEAGLPPSGLAVILHAQGRSPGNEPQGRQPDPPRVWGPCGRRDGQDNRDPTNGSPLMSPWCLNPTPTPHQQEEKALQNVQPEPRLRGCYQRGHCAHTCCCLRDSPAFWCLGPVSQLLAQQQQAPRTAHGTADNSWGYPARVARSPTV